MPHLIRFHGSKRSQYFHFNYICGSTCQEKNVILSIHQLNIGGLVQDCSIHCSRTGDIAALDQAINIFELQAASMQLYTNAYCLRHRFLSCPNKTFWLTTSLITHFRNSFPTKGICWYIDNFIFMMSAWVKRNNIASKMTDMRSEYQCVITEFNLIDMSHRQALATLSISIIFREWYQNILKELFTALRWRHCTFLNV